MCAATRGDMPVPEFLPEFLPVLLPEFLPVPHAA
jgi:hypothetical protein